MSEHKTFDLAKSFNSIADRVGFQIGQQIPPRLLRLLDRMVKAGQLGENLEEVSPGAYTAIRKFLEFLGNTTEIPRRVIPVPGLVGDIVHEVLNEGLDSAARGVGDSPKAGEKPAGKSGDVQKKNDLLERKGYVVSGIWYPDDCTHQDPPLPTFVPKGGPPSPPRTRITLVQALQRGHGYCQRGCVSGSEVDAAHAALAAAAASTTNADQAKAVLAPGASPEKVPEGTTLFDHWMRFEAECRSAGEEGVYEAAFSAYEAADEKIKKKFDAAFHGRDNYKQFREVARKFGANWELMLNTILGQPKSAEEKPGGLMDKVRKIKTALGELGIEEQKQFNQVFDAIGGELDKIAASMKARLGFPEPPQPPKATLESWLQTRAAVRAAARRWREKRNHWFVRLGFDWALPIGIALVVISALRQC